MEQMVGSPACIPQITLEEILPVYAALGLRKFEVFSSWCKSAVDISRPPETYLALARAHGFRFTSMHLPPINNDLAASLESAVSHARFAKALGAEIVLYKANSRENYIRGAKPFLDAIEGAGITPVLQNHKGSPITTLADFREVISGIADPRMKTLLEVGHFQRAGVDWREGYDLLGESIALVHVNDIDAAGESVPFGTGLVDFAGLFERLAEDGYRGDVVVELELSTRDKDIQRTIDYLAKALEWLGSLCTGTAA